MHRSDGSGTTFNFTNYLSKVSPDWKSKVGENTAVEWPVGLGAKGNEGVANNVANTKGAIGYVEYAYAKQNKLTSTKMINKDGKTVAPTVDAFRAAAANADWEHAPGFYQILTDQPGAESWPITASTFILMHKQPKDAAASAEALKFFAWAFEKGGKEAEALDYIPMPAKVVTLIKKEIDATIKWPDGKPVYEMQSVAGRREATVSRTPRPGAARRPASRPPNRALAGRRVDQEPSWPISRCETSRHARAVARGSLRVLPRFRSSMRSSAA